MRHQGSGERGMEGERLLARVRPVLDRHLDDPAVEAALVTGSVAEGRTDAHSDVDVIVYRRFPMDHAAFERVRDAAIASGGGLYGGDAVQGFAVHYRVDGVKFDLGVGTVAETDEMIASVVDQLDLELEKQLMIDGIRRGRVLKGEATVRRWRQRTDTYPEALARAMVERHAAPVPPRVMRSMGLERDDPFLVAETILEGVRRIAATLFGLNRAWHPGKLKAIGSRLAELPVVPASVVPRLRGLVRGPQAPAVEAYAQLATEVLDLVAERMPEADVSRARATLSSEGAARR